MLATSVKHGVLKFFTTLTSNHFNAHTSLQHILIIIIDSYDEICLFSMEACEHLLEQTREFRLLPLHSDSLAHFDK